MRDPCRLYLITPPEFALDRSAFQIRSAESPVGFRESAPRLDSLKEGLSDVVWA